MHHAFKATKFINGSWMDAHAFADTLPHGTVPVLCVKVNSTTGVYITKQQVMEFFGLIDPQNPKAVHALMHEVLAQPRTKSYDVAPDLAVNAIVAKPAVIDWDILYLEDENGTVVKHTQYEGNTREEAIAAFRAGHGTVRYIVGITQRELDLDA